MEDRPSDIVECERDVDGLLDAIDLIRKGEVPYDVIPIFVQDHERPEVAKTKGLDLEKVHNLLLRIRKYIKALPGHSFDSSGSLDEDRALLCAEAVRLLAELEIRGFEGTFDTACIDIDLKACACFGLLLLESSGHG
jgi:hypothetical protein